MFLASIAQDIYYIKQTPSCSIFTATLFWSRAGHLLNKTNPDLSYFELSYVFWELNDSVDRGTTVHDYFVLHFLPSTIQESGLDAWFLFHTTVLRSGLCFSLFFVFISHGVACIFPAFVVKLTAAQAFIVRNRLLKASFAFCLIVKVICLKCYKHSKEAAQQSHLSTSKMGWFLRDYLAHQVIT